MIRAAARRRDAEQNDWLLRGTPLPPWLRWPPPLLLVAAALLQWITPETVDLTFLVAAAPPLAALSYGPAATALLGGTVIMLLALPDVGLGRPGNRDELTIAFIALLSVVFAWVRSRREAQLVTVRTVAEAAQFAVLPPLPERVGRVRFAGLYQAAQHESLSAATSSTYAGGRGAYGPSSVMYGGTGSPPSAPSPHCSAPSARRSSTSPT